jgi:two-component system response regulator NreC
MTIRCLIVDDHAPFREALRSVLQTEADIEVVGEARDGSESVEKVRELNPDVVIMDVATPGSSSTFEAARIMQQLSPSSHLIFLSAHEDEQSLLQCLEVGAAGYLPKDSPALKLVSAVREVSQGRKYLSPHVLGKLVDDFRSRSVHGLPRGSKLTPREAEVIKMLAEGNSVKEIASLLSLSVKTVEAHKFNLMRKLDIHNKAQLVTYAIQKKIVKMPAGV